MTYDATEILEQAESEQENILEHTRDAADWFHDREGELFERDEARDRLADDLNVDDDIAQSLIAELVGDDVDPIVLARAQGVKYVGVAEFKEFDGAYGYLDYHDLHGKRRRVICAQCVHEATHDTEVTHATAGDPEGSYGRDASYSDLLGGIYDHYEEAHDELPENVETGASLVSGTTIGGNTAWHAGNDGNGSGLDADTLDGIESDNIGENIFDLPKSFHANSYNDIDTTYTYTLNNGVITSLYLFGKGAYGTTNYEGRVTMTMHFTDGTSKDYQARGYGNDEPAQTEEKDFGLFAVESNGTATLDSIDVEISTGSDSHARYRLAYVEDV